MLEAVTGSTMSTILVLRECACMCNAMTENKNRKTNGNQNVSNEQKKIVCTKHF